MSNFKRLEQTAQIQYPKYYPNYRMICEMLQTESGAPGHKKSIDFKMKKRIEHRNRVTERTKSHR